MLFTLPSDCLLLILSELNLCEAKRLFSLCKRVHNKTRKTSIKKRIEEMKTWMVTVNAIRASEEDEEDSLPDVICDMLADATNIYQAPAEELISCLVAKYTSEELTSLIVKNFKRVTANILSKLDTYALAVMFVTIFFESEGNVTMAIKSQAEYDFRYLVRLPWRLTEEWSYEWKNQSRRKKNRDIAWRKCVKEIIMQLITSKDRTDEGRKKRIMFYLKKKHIEDSDHKSIRKCLYKAPEYIRDYNFGCEYKKGVYTPVKLS